MRIAYVTTDPGIPVWGSKGASIHVQEMLRAFLAAGAEIALLSPRLEGEAPPDLRAVRLVPLPPSPKGAPEVRARLQLGANKAVREALGALWPLDLVYERHALYAHAAMERARERGVPGVLEVNAPLLREEAAHRGLALPEEAEASARRAMAAARVATAVSPEVARHAWALGAAAVHVVPNAVNPARFPIQPAPEGPFTVAFLGTLKPWHDVATLIEALARLRAGPVPEARLLVVGDGPERGRLEDILARLGVAEAAEFLGAVPAAEVPRALARAHVGAAPYAAGGDFYFSPLKIYEYMAAGLPVVASRVGHLAEVVAGGRTGVLVPPGDALLLAEALARLARSPELRAALGQAARAEVLARHTWDDVARRVLALAGLAGKAAA